MHFKLSYLLAALFLAPGLAFADGNHKPIGEAAAKKLPIFDSHVHYKEPAWGGPSACSVQGDLFRSLAFAQRHLPGNPQGLERFLQATPISIWPHLQETTVEPLEVQSAADQGQLVAWEGQP